MSKHSFETRPLIGLEIHVQLATRTKLFCACKVEFGAEPNSRVCPVCLGLPGALPVINRQALKLATRLALALNCEIARSTKWDRKSYFYPDLPKNYQISQYDLPIGSKGRFDFECDGARKSVEIRRVHLEEDAGKNLHDHASFTQIDLNRAGTPLLEIVTEPDLHTAADAFAFCTALQQLVTYLGISEGEMQKGHMRFEPNVNVIIQDHGLEIATPISEVKNLNSFKALRGAVEYEIERQVEAWQRDSKYTAELSPKENRGWDDRNNITVFQRRKEEAHDYRYFPDPDLLPVVIDEEQLEALRAELPELPPARRARLMRECGLTPADAARIVSDRPTAELFDAAVAAGAAPEVLAKHFGSFWAKHANAQNLTLADLGVSPAGMAELSGMVAAGRINATAAAKISTIMLESGQSPAAIAKAEGLQLDHDPAATEALVDQAIADNPKAVEIAKGGGKKWQKSLGFLQGQVMQKTKGSAPPQLVRELLERKLGLK